VTTLAERGVGFRSLQEQVDTTTPGGKLVFHVFAALAEFERDLVRERTSAGLAAARARGRRGGRPSVMPPHKLRVARELYASGQYTVAANRQNARGEPRLGLPPPAAHHQRLTTAAPTPADPSRNGRADLCFRRPRVSRIDLVMGEPQG
jgi:hypothetical protein